MNCDNYLDLMSAVLDGECTAQERQELDSHLAVCPECANLFHILSANTAAARELDCEMPADLKSRIMSSLPEQDKAVKQGKVISWKRWVPVAAAACLILVISMIPGGLDGAAMNEAAPDAAPAASSMLDTRDGYAYGAAEDPQAYESDAEAIPSHAPGKLETADPVQYAFSNPRAIRVHYGATPESGAVIVDSVKSLEAYLDGFDSLMWDGEGNVIPIGELGKLTEAYTEDYFKTHRLLCVVVISGSGSNRYELLSLTRDTVTVLEDIPEVGICDMAAWLLVAEVDTMFSAGDTLEVDFIR